MSQSRKIAVLSIVSPQDLTLPKYVKVFHWYHLDENINFRDYDALIVDLDGINISQVDWSLFREILNPSICVDILGPNGSYIAVLGDPSFQIPGQGAFMDWSPFLFKWIKGKGDSISLTDSGKKSLYREYLQYVKSYTYSYSKTGVNDEVRKMFSKQNYTVASRQIEYLTNRAGYQCGSSVWLSLNQANYPYNEIEVLGGDFLLLPRTTRESKEDILQVITINEQSSDTSEPKWVEALSVEGQSKIDEEIVDEAEIIRTAQAKMVELRKSRLQLRETLKLLYVADKQLETAVKAVFSDLGGVVREPKEGNKIEFYLSYEGMNFAPEVKSTNKAHIEQKGLRQALDWSNDAYDETGNEHKAILVVSNQYGLPPSEREGNPLEDNLENYAKARNICVVTVQTLFEAHQAIKRGELESSAFFASIHKHQGMFFLTAKE